MDEIIVNANLLENSPDSVAAAVGQTTLPYSIDPLLTRFQIPAWWRNDRGETKRNYARLGAAYVEGTSIKIASGPLLDTVAKESDWRTVGRNVVRYQRDRLLEIRPQLELFREPLKPARVLGPALVAFTRAEDRINRILADAASDAVGGAGIGLPVIVPEDRLRSRAEVSRMLTSVPKDGIGAYFLWTPWMTEDVLLADNSLLASLLHLVSELAGRGIPVGHLHATYAITALRDYGLAAVVHHLGWIDKGEPADQPRGGLRSCRTYVPGVRRALPFGRARELGRRLGPSEYEDRYCGCGFCNGAFNANQHPLDLLLEDQSVHFRNGHDRLTPTGRAVALNTWHYALARRQEVAAFSANASADVLRRDIERAAALAGRADSDRLRRLAEGLG